MEEFTHTLLENGSIERKDEKYVLSGKASDIQVPDTIQGIIAARLDRLEDNLKRTMQVASVIGRDFAFRILQTITGMREELKSYLLNLQGLEFIYEKRLFPELEYIFKHALTQEVAYNSLLLKRRKEIHARIGKAIEELYAERLEEFYEMLAYHYSRSYRLEKAVRYLWLSADKATRNNSLWEALRFHKQPLGILGRISETAETKKECLAVILSMAPIFRLLSYPEDPMEFFKQGETISTEFEDHRSMAIISSSIGMYYSMKGNLALGRSYLERSFHEAARASDLNTLGPLAYGLFVSYLWEGKYAKIADMAPKVIHLLEETHREGEDLGTPANLYCTLHGQFGLSLAWLGDFEKAEEHCMKGLSFASKLDHLFTIGIAEMFYGSVLMVKGIGEGSAEHLRRSLDTFEKSQGMVFTPLVQSCLGMAHYFMGNALTALEHMEKGLRMQVTSGLSFLLSFQHYCLGVVHMESGDFTKALFHAQEAVNLARKHNERETEGLALGLLGMVGWKTQKMLLNEAEESIRHGIKIADELKLTTVEAFGYKSLGELFADAGQRAKALENLKKAESMYLEMGLDPRSYWLVRTQEVLARL